MIKLAIRTTRFHRLLRHVQRPWTRHLERRALERYTAFAYRLLDRLTKDGHIDFEGATPVITKALQTRSDVIVLLVGKAGAADASLILKLPLTPDAQRSTTSHRQVVMSLHQLPDLGGMSRLIPSALTWGEYEQQAYYLETALPGLAVNELVRTRNEPHSLKSDAVAAIRQLHLATAQRLVVDESVFRELVGGELAQLRQLAPRWPEAPMLTLQLQAIEELLRRQLLGRELPFSWTHGDYWPGNILVCPADGSLSGIVDWDRASAHQLPLVDVLHFLAYTRKMQRRTELGEEVVAYLLPAAFDAQERSLIDETVEQLGLPKSAEFLHAVALLYWLQFAATNLSRYPSFQHDEYWMRKNVLLVLKRGLS